jgi:hypothetical protein
MARLAFLTSLAPTLRPDTGFEIANLAVIEGLRAQGHRVRVFAYARPDDALAPDDDLVLLGRMEIENHRASAPQRLQWLAMALRTGLPVACAKLRRPDSDIADRLRADGPFDAVVASGVTMIGAYPAAAGLAPLLFVSHNVEHVSAQQNADFARGLAMKALYRREARLVEALEREIIAKARFTWFLADEDRAVFAAEAGERASVLPLLHRRSPPPPQPGISASAEAMADVGLIGTWTWEPNLIGLRWFLTDVAPLLPRGFKVAVAGRAPPGLPAHANVAMLGRVPDAEAFLEGCRTVALCSRGGTGVQLKTIEVLQAGMPAVATSLSMRGVAARPGNLVVADDARAFAAGLITLVEQARNGASGRTDGSGFVREQGDAQVRALTQGLVAALGHKAQP